MITSRRRLALSVTVLLGAVLPGLATPPATAGIDGEIVYARSTDGGASFEGYANLSQGTEGSELPHAAASEGAVQVVWKEAVPEGDVFARRSAGGGAFEGGTNLTSSPEDSSEPDLAVTGTTLTVVFTEELEGEDEVFALTSADGGATFGDRVNVSQSATPSKDPDVAAGEGLMAVVYEEQLSETNEDILFRSSTDAGAKWSKAVNVSQDAEQSSEPALATSGQAVHVVWNDRGDALDVSDDRIGYARSADGGKTFDSPVSLPAPVAMHSAGVAVDGEVVQVVACSPADKSGIFASDLYHLRSTDGGATWSEPVNLSVNSGDCKRPTVAAHGGSVYVAWADSTTGRTDILLRRSGDGGAGFGKTQNVSRSRGDSEDPVLAVDASSGTVHVVWTDYSVDPATPAAVADLPPTGASPIPPPADPGGVGLPPSGDTATPGARGYWMVASDGGLFAFGDAGFYGSMGAKPLNQPIVAMAATPSGKGYWLAAADGGVFAFGDAGFHGSTGAMALRRPIVAMVPTTSGKGYWLAAADGGVFAFGDAGFHGSMGGSPLNRPIVGMAGTPTGRGYRLVASDGGIFAFGDAGFFGSTGAGPVDKPIVAMAVTPSGKGYWLVASDGGIFAFGDAGFHGSTAASVPGRPIVTMAPTTTGRGYWLVASDGGIFAFGDAGFYGSMGGSPLNRPIVNAARR